MEFQCARDAYCEGFHRLRALEAELASRREALQRGAEERNYLRFLVEELAGAGVSAGEKARISAELHLLENAEEVVRQVGTAAHLLYEGDERAPSAFDVIARTNKELGELAGDSRPQGTLAKVVEALTRAMESVAEAKDLLAELGEMPDYSPADIERLRRRLDEINRLEHKHRTPADELPRLLESSQATLDTLETTPGEVEALESRVAELSSKLVAGARRLNEGRRLIARHLEGAASRHLSKLGFASAEFIVEVFEPEDPSPEDLREHGLGHVEFIISLNPDEPARPLAEVASGGEASRLLLAVKGALQSQLSYGTIVFDEIEAGIGGDAAFNVAGVLRDLASKHQVIVVTHLAAVAAAARHHFDVVKSVRKGRTDITVEELTGERRVKTLARMLGDAEQAASRALAEEFLRRMS
ncbi:MAG: hypothetical protein A2Y63_01575 [Candidatus Riflebacteria bacterium RBG_13_59_9]|nr:MAG: hypothetical protein A2Y63_01575 [Candidatus Riflebacteria bacterium RBG_13_59_9]